MSLVIGRRKLQEYDVKKPHLNDYDVNTFKKNHILIYKDDTEHTFI